MAERPSQSDGSQATVRTLRSHLAVIRRYALFTVLVVAVALAGTFALTQRQERVYSTSARVLLRTNSTLPLFPFAGTAPSTLLRLGETEELYARSPEFQTAVRAEAPSGATVSVRSGGNDLIFTARGASPEAAAEAANYWAQRYITDRQAAFELQTKTSIEFLNFSIDELQGERAELRREVVELERLLTETTDPDQYSRLLSQKVSIEAILGPDLDPVDRQISDFGRELAELELLSRFTDDPEISARVSQVAGVPTSPSSPNLMRNLIVGGLLGLALGLGLPYLRQALNDRVDDGTEAGETSGLDVLGTVPIFKPLSDTSVEVFDRPASIASERYQAVLTAIEFASADESIGSLVFTSPSPGDGKTTTAVNLAALASKHLNVLLVDADMRRPSIHDLLRLTNRVGLSNVLEGDADVFDARQVIERGEHRFDVLTAGTTPDDPALLLRGEKWTRLMNDLFLYDLVIIDAPPVLAVTDALLAASRADAQILVSRAGKTTKSELAEATDLMATNGCRSIGIVVTAEPVKGGSYAYYGEYPRESV